MLEIMWLLTAFLIVKLYGCGKFCDLHFPCPIGTDVEVTTVNQASVIIRKMFVVPEANELDRDFQC